MSSEEGSSGVVRVGILGTGKIAQDFTQALKDVTEATIVAVGSRSKESAQRFGESLGLTENQCFPSYEALAQASDIDLVYIATPHSFHYEHCRLCFDNNKNVLCEKALTLSAKQSEKLVEIAREKNLFFMEALWTRYIPSYEYLIKNILPKLGNIRMARATFGFNDPGVQRLSDPKLGGGAILDIGVYAVNFCSIAFGDRPVQKIQATGIVDDNNIDSEVSATLLFEGEENAAAKPGFGQIFCSFSSDPPCEGLIVGENGYVKVHAPFWCSTKLSVKLNINGLANPQEIRFAKPNSNDQSKYNFKNSALLQYEARHACQQILNGKKESEIFNLDSSVRIMKILDELRSQIGVTYPNESV